MNQAAEGRVAGGRRPAVWVAAVVAVLALWCGAHVGLEQDVLRLLPRSDRAVHDYLEVLQRFQGLDKILIDLWRPGAPYDPLTERAAEVLSRELEASPAIVGVRSRTGLAELRASLELLEAHRASLFSEDVERRVVQSLDEDAIRSRVEEFKRQLVSFPDPVSVRLFERDPLGLNEILLDLLPSPVAAGGGATMVDGWLWSADGEHLLLLAEPRSSDLDSTAARAMVEDIEAAVAAAEEVGGPELEIAHLSRYRAALDNETTVRGDIARSLWVSGAGIALVLVLAFGLGRRPLALGLTPLFGGVVGMACLALIYGRVSPLVVGCGSIVLGIAVDYAIHVAFRAQAEGGRLAAARHTARPLFLAATTTAGAFLTMLASELPGHRQLGVFAAAGVGAAALFAVLVLPHLLPGAGRNASPPVAVVVARVMARTVGRLQRHGLLTSLAVVVLAVAAVLGVLRLRVESDMERFNALSPAASADSRRIGEAWGAALGQSSLAVGGGTLEQALEEAETLQGELVEQRAAGRITALQTVVGLLPSPHTQTVNRERWRAFWSAERIASLRTMVEQVMRAAGLRPQPVAAFWDGVSETGGELRYADFQHTALAELLGAWVAADEEGGWWVLSRVVVPTGGSVEALGKELRQHHPRLLVADGPQMMQRLSEIIYRELVRMSLLSFAVVALVVWLFFRSWRRPATVLVVLLVTFLWTLGAMGWLGVPVTMMNSMIAIFLFGLTVDYAVFLMHAVSAAEDRPELVSGAVVISSLTTLVGFGALLLAHHPSLHIIGLTTVVGVVCGLAAAVGVVAVAASLDDGADQ